MTLLIDPMLELAQELARIEDWLLWAECDTDDQAAVVDAGANAAASLASAVRAAFAGAAQLFDPAGAELAPVAGIPSEAVRDAYRAMTAGADAVDGGGVRRPDAALRSVGVIARCIDQDGTDAVRLLAALLAQADTGGSCWYVATVRTEDDRGAPIEQERVATRLDIDEYQAYRRYLAAVLTDPFTRFAATGT